MDTNSALIDRRRRPPLAKPLLALALLASLFGAAECSTSAVDPQAGSTLLVVNGTCTAAGCEVLHVLGFPTANQPATPGGLWSLDLGTTDARQVCLAIPPSATFRVVGQRAAGGSDTVVTTWTSALPLALGLVSPGLTSFQAAPSTRTFIPAQARGWRITLPGDSTAVPAEPCGP
jgi:hypothetical protein